MRKFQEWGDVWAAVRLRNAKYEIQGIEFEAESELFS